MKLMLLLSLSLQVKTIILLLVVFSSFFSFRSSLACVCTFFRSFNLIRKERGRFVEEMKMMFFFFKICILIILSVNNNNIYPFSSSISILTSFFFRSFFESSNCLFECNITNKKKRKKREKHFDEHRENEGVCCECKPSEECSGNKYMFNRC